MVNQVALDALWTKAWPGQQAKQRDDKSKRLRSCQTLIIFTYSQFSLNLVLVESTNSKDTRTDGRKYQMKSLGGTLPPQRCAEARRAAAKEDKSFSLSELESESPSIASGCQGRIRNRSEDQIKPVNNNYFLKTHTQAFGPLVAVASNSSNQANYSPVAATGSLYI